MPNRILRTLFLYNGVFVLANNLLGPLYAIYVGGFNTGILPISLSWATYLISATLFMFLLSKLGDKFKKKRLLVCLGYIIRSACWLFMSYITTIEQLIVAQFILGIGEALGTPSFDAIFAEHLDKGKHIMDYADWKLITNAVLVLGTIVGGLIVSNFGFPVLFRFMSGLVMISLIGFLVNPKIDSSNNYF